METNSLQALHAAGDPSVQRFDLPVTIRGVALTLGSYRRCFDNTDAKSLRGLPDAMRAMLLTHSYASKEHPGVRYVRGDTYLRMFKVPGVDRKTPLTAASARTLADDFVRRAYGANARRIDTISLDVSEKNVTKEPRT